MRHPEIYGPAVRCPSYNSAPPGVRSIHYWLSTDPVADERFVRQLHALKPREDRLWGG
jgi:hypothetical protein